ncbi:MAG: NADH-quinone oxidoreductase subunit L [Planctomycetaceae bacterium]|nr:MAG: NADH-quinone oxidoreductase subunit L [Planctomycetaceae bacterium]
MIIPALHRYQERRGGYLTREDQRRVARECGVPLYRVQELVSFFPHFRTTPPPQVQVHVCRDMSCHLRGSTRLIERLNDEVGENTGSGAAGSPGSAGTVEIEGVSCLGRCDRAPAVLINERLYAGRTADDLCGIVRRYLNGGQPDADTDSDWSLAQRPDGASTPPAASGIAKAGPGEGNAKDDTAWQIDPYGNDPDERPDYRLVRRYLEDPDPAGVLTALETAGLLGMGGAGGRTYLKWGDVLAAEGKAKYVVCNADESEPGTFKDREILLRHPHLVIEGMILGGLVVGADQGWIYVRHEYPEQIARLRREIRRANRIGVLGNDLLGSGESFQLDVFISPGGYICGEQTALIEAMEDKRAEPRNRPPELMTNGYQNQPTLLNNVETFAWVPAILDRSGGAWYRDQGFKTGPFELAGQGERVHGRRLFSISGDVARPGVYEVPTAITLGELIDRYAGGMRDGEPPQAVALSGPSGGLWPAKIPADQFSSGFAKTLAGAGVKEVDVRDLPLDINVSRAMGFMLGAGLVVYGAKADIVAEALACSRFFRNESCGKCVPCRIGSEKITSLVSGIERGGIAAGELPVVRDVITELGGVMEATSICGLGQVASNPARTLLRFFPDLVAARCDAAATVSDGGMSEDEASSGVQEISTAGGPDLEGDQPNGF